MQTFNIEEELFKLSEKAYRAFPVDEVESVSIVINPIVVKNKREVQIWIDICDECGNQLNKYKEEIKSSFVEMSSFQLAFKSLDQYLESILDKRMSNNSSKILEEGEAMFEHTGFGD